MNKQKRYRIFRWRTFVLAALVLAAGGAARAQSRDVGEILKLKTAPPNPRDFVIQSRKPADSLQYLPVNGARAEPARAALTPDQVRAREAELDSVRAKHDAMAKRPPAPRGKSPAAPPAKTVAAAKTNCLITCQVNSDVANTVVNTVAPPATALENRQ